MPPLGDCVKDRFPTPLAPSECAVVDPWALPPPHFSAVRLAMRQRASLVPLLYTLSRQAHHTGLVPLRPMYYSWPHLEGAYRASSYTGCVGGGGEGSSARQVGALYLTTSVVC
jgi:hypothetical protein